MLPSTAAANGNIVWTGKYITHGAWPDAHTPYAGKNGNSKSGNFANWNSASPATADFPPHAPPPAG
jgi:hypothetical protein